MHLRYRSAGWLGLVATLLFTLSPASGQILIQDIIAGGDGSGNAPAANVGIDQRNGQFITAHAVGTNQETDPEGDGVNPSPGASEYVDSVFYIGPFADYPPGEAPDTFVMPINQDGAEYEFPNADGIGTGWNFILKNVNAGGGAPPMMVGGQPVPHGVGIHSSMGVTIDLEALRATHGADAVGCFNTFWGTDGCGTVDVVLYAILSDDVEILDVYTQPALVNEGALLQVDIPADALYLTIATGSNGADGCDHGNFGVAQITPGACAEPEIVGVTVDPDVATIAPGGLQQLTVLAMDDLGLPTDVTAAVDGTTYSVDPDGVVTVSEDGLVTGVGIGEATVTATSAGFDGTATITVEDLGYLDLGDMVVGGNGLGTADPTFIGINADTAALGVARGIGNINETDGFNPRPADGIDGALDSEFVDSVFILTQDFEMPINSANVPFDFATGDTTVGWELILNGREPGGPDNLQFGPVTFTEGVGVHGSQGITFDLENLRGEHGDEAVQYVSAVAGECSGQVNGLVNVYMILSDDAEIIDSVSVLGAADSGRFLQMEIPEDAIYLTLATGSAGNGNGSDHGGFGLARITRDPVDTEIAEISVSPSTLVLNIDQQTQLTVEGLLGGDLAGVPTEVDPADIEFASDDDGVAEVDDTGLVTGEASGETIIRVTVGELTAEVAVTVGLTLDLADMISGGDGTGTAPLENLGLDPRNGQFALVSFGGHLYEADFEGDGEDPSPVLDTDFVDSVFIIGERDVGAPANVPVGGPPIEQVITQSGVVFEFPSQDGFGSVWNHIMRNANGGEAGPEVLVGNVQYETGIGLHAAGGVTFDLEVVREEHGPEAAAAFSTVWGMDTCGGDVNLYAILSNDDGVISSEMYNATQNSGEALTIRIPLAATYLTLATGSNGGDGCDHGTFADARLVTGEPLECPDEGDTHADTLEVISIDGPNFFGVYSVEVEATATDDSGDSISYTFEVEDEAGNVVRIGPQDTGTATLSLRAGVATVTVSVDDVTDCPDVADDATRSIEVCLGDDCEEGGVGPFVRGDCNGDGNVIGQVGDAVFVLNFNFTGGPVPVCMAACDSNADGNVIGQVGDAIYTLNFNFLGGPAIPAPFPECATSTAEDDVALGCETPIACP